MARRDRGHERGAAAAGLAGADENGRGSWRYRKELRPAKAATAAGGKTRLVIRSIEA
jgi:hypothetical protein